MLSNRITCLEQANDRSIKFETNLGVIESECDECRIHPSWLPLEFKLLVH